MTTIKEFKGYSIYVEKKDDVLLTDITAVAFIICILLFFASILLTVWLFPGGILIVAACVAIVIIVSIFMRPGCGVRVSLWYGASKLIFSEYKFTNNAEKDALKIQKIIDLLEQKANDRDRSIADSEAKNRANEEKCCAQYSGVMNRIKEKPS